MEFLQSGEQLSFPAMFEEQSREQLSFPAMVGRAVVPEVAAHLHAEAAQVFGSEHLAQMGSSNLTPNELHKGCQRQHREDRRMKREIAWLRTNTR